MSQTLATLAAWAWRLIVVGVVVYAVVWGLAYLKFVTLPVAVALLLTALLYPLAARLKRVMRPIYAAWITILTALAVIIGTGVLIGVRANEEYPRFAAQVQKTAKDVEIWLKTGPLNLKQSQLEGMANELINQLNQQRGVITGTVASAATVAIEVLAGIILVLFITFFLLKDGEQIWEWFLRIFGDIKPRVDRAGRVAWHTLSRYVQGTVLVAAIHSVVMAIVLATIGVPLWAPLAVLIFLASFVPIVGILFAGGLAVLVTLGAKGWVWALIVLGVLILEQQIENHLLQPLVVGRVLRFHPLAIILVLALGAVLAGVAGAAIAVPIAAVLYRALPELRSTPPELPAAPAPSAEPPPATG